MQDQPLSTKQTVLVIILAIIGFILPALVYLVTCCGVHSISW